MKVNKKLLLHFQFSISRFQALFEKILSILIESNVPRYILAAGLSAILHLAILGSYLGLSRLNEPEILKIREISFVDLTQEPMEKNTPKPESVRKPKKRKIITKPGKPSILAHKNPVESPNLKQSSGVPHRMDMIRKQAPISLASHAAVALAKPRPRDRIEISPAKGTQKHKKASLINLDKKSRLKLVGTKKIGALTNAVQAGPQIAFNKKDLNSELIASTNQSRLLQSLLRDEQKMQSAPEKSRTFITGPLSSRKILRKSIPRFPHWAKREGIGAAIALQFTVMEDGRIRENIVVVRTSGLREWDNAVAQVLKEWRFAPLADGVPRQDQSGTITFQFVID